jgi:hypothetical protein
MAHFAELDENNIVKRVIVVDNKELLKFGIEDEQTGKDFLKKVFKKDLKWVQTSYNNNKRGKYAAIGDTYDFIKDVFIPPKPYPSWTLDKNFKWQPPTPLPDKNNMYVWDEENKEWIKWE